MRFLSWLHRWVGAITGLVLALLGASGAVLVWRDALVRVPHAHDAVRDDPAALARIVARIATGPTPVDRITFAGPDLGVHQIAFADGSGAYLSQHGEIVARWTTGWQRPELWLFDLHHHLFLGDAGEAATGIVGFVGLFFVVSGLILWWRMRRRFRPRLWPARMAPGAIVHHHRDLGVVTAPLLFLSLLTGVMMVFAPVSQFLLGPLGSDRRLPAPAAPSHSLAEAADLAPIFIVAGTRFPAAEVRRLQFPRKPGAALALRLRQPFEWTGNGRTLLYFDPATLALLDVADPAGRSAAASVQEKLYPVHAAKTGGILWKLAMTASGVALTLLGSLAVYGFWKTRWNAVRKARHRRN